MIPAFLPWRMMLLAVTAPVLPLAGLGESSLIKYKDDTQYFTVYRTAENRTFKLFGEVGRFYLAVNSSGSISIGQHAIVVPYLNQGRRPSVRFRFITGENDAFQELQKDINAAKTPYRNFRASWACVATWTSGESLHANLVQVVLLGNIDNTETFLTLNYHLKFIPNARNTHFTQIFMGDLKRSEPELYPLPDDIKTLTFSSNCNIPGKWIFRISDSIQVIRRQNNNFGHPCVPHGAAQLPDRDDQCNGDLVCRRVASGHSGDATLTSGHSCRCPSGQSVVTCRAHIDRVCHIGSTKEICRQKFPCRDEEDGFKGKYCVRDKSRGTRRPRRRRVDSIAAARRSRRAVGVPAIDVTSTVFNASLATVVSAAVLVSLAVIIMLGAIVCVCLKKKCNAWRHMDRARNISQFGQARRQLRQAFRQKFLRSRQKCVEVDSLWASHSQISIESSTEDWQPHRHVYAETSIDGGTTMSIPKKEGSSKSWKATAQSYRSSADSRTTCTGVGSGRSASVGTNKSSNGTSKSNKDARSRKKASKIKCKQVSEVPASEDDLEVARRVSRMWVLQLLDMIQSKFSCAGSEMSANVGISGGTSVGLQTEKEKDVSGTSAEEGRVSVTTRGGRKDNERKHTFKQSSRKSSTGSSKSNHNGSCGKSNSNK